jgi:tetratricopeptide (TPR) repeat protein
MGSFLVLMALAAAPPAPGGATPELPPGHPKIEASQPSSSAPAQLPPGHPKIDEGESSSKTPAQLPPGHPKIDEGDSSSSPPTQLPTGHPPVKEGASARTADELLKRLDATPNLKERVKTFEIAASIGKLYYGSARYSDAAVYLGEAEKLAEPARALFLKQRKMLAKKGMPTLEAARCETSPNSPLSAQLEKSKRRADGGELAAATRCLLASLEPVLEVSELRAKALFLAEDAKGALATYERVLGVSEDRPESLYGHAGALFDTQGDNVPALRRAKAEWERYLRLDPKSVKTGQVQKLIRRCDEAIAAGGLTAFARSHASKATTRLADAAKPPASATGEGIAPVTPDMIQAIKNTERTPELESGLSKLIDEGEEHLARGRYQEALDAYKRVVPFQPDNGRAKAGMAWALVGLNKPTADRIWSVAVSADPAAVDKLGDTLTAKGNKADAKALWTKLATTDPAYAERAKLSKKVQ